MALDTRSKRGSALGVGLPWVMALPEPDATINQGDRQHVGMSYSGILATALVIVTAVADAIVRVRQRVTTIRV